MGYSFKLLSLTAAIGVAVSAGFGLQNAAATAGNPLLELVSEASSVPNTDGTYIITFAEEGLYNYEGGVSGFARTAPTGVAGKRKLDGSSPDAQAYGNYLAAQRALHLASIESSLGRLLDVTHSYAVTINGIAAELTPAEASAIANLPGVKSVKPAGVYQLDTYRGPSFIGANKIWDGSSTPSAVGTKGQGVRVGIIDGGAASVHPSFANDASCGFSAAAPKLIAYDCSTSSGGLCTGPDPQANPTFGHGVHTASTVAGNTIDNTVTPAPLLSDGNTMSGVAPCAAINQYKVCPTNSCGGAAIAAGIENAIFDGVDVINFSISGGTSPWSTGESDRAFLDAVDAGVFVAASAGNNSAENLAVIGRVNHRGPWVMTVAASTHDQKIGPEISIVGPGTPPSTLENVGINPGSTTLLSAVTDLSSYAVRTLPANIEGCTASGGVPAGYFANSIAVIRRGTCAFTEKITNAYDAGANVVLIVNNQAGSISMDTTGAPNVPAFSINDVTVGDAMIAFVNANLVLPNADLIFANGFETTSGGGAVADLMRSASSTRQPDVIGDFSFRGPTPAPLADLTKPDITGPGVDIYAATDPASGDYELMSGTSMSGPHVAGAGALLTAVHPTWTPMEIKSALMMTAKPDGYMENGTTPWDVDVVGSGRVDVAKAALAGLTLNETKANFLAANPATSGDVKTLNIASLRNMSCNGGCSWTRKVKNRLSTSGTWNVTSASDASFTVSASPATFILAPGAEQTITFTASPVATSTVAKFGYVTFVESSNRSPAQHLTVAIKGTAAGLPTIAVTPTALIASVAVGASTTQPLSVANTGGGTLNWSVASNANGVIIDQQPSGTNGVVSSYSVAQNGGLFGAVDFTVGNSTVIRKIVAYGFDNTNSLLAQPTITWRLYSDNAGLPNGNPATGAGTPIWTYSAAPTSTGISISGTGEITLDLAAISQPQTVAAGTYWLTVTPTYSGNIGAATDARWAWFYAAGTGTAPAKLIGPLFGVNAWTNLATVVAGAGPDFAFKMEGDVACGAPWLSLSPTSGAVAGGSSSAVTASFNATGLTAGTYTATACIASNDAINPIVKIPVTMTVTSGGGGSCTPIQLLQDPSFEASLGGGVWSSTSTNYGTAMCNLTGCGNGGGTAGPRTGDIWAWFGGASDNAETATATQSVVIPSGSPRFLNFGLRVGAIGGVGAKLETLVGSTVVATFPEPAAAEAAYTMRSVDISAHATGGAAQAVTFRYTTAAGVESNSNFNVDDVTIDCAAAPASAPVATEVSSSINTARSH